MASGQKPSKSDQDGMLQQIGRASAVGGNFAAAVVGMGLIGWLVQKYWLTNSAPWPLLAGFAVGLVGGFYQFVRDATAAERDSK